MVHSLSTAITKFRQVWETRRWKVGYLQSGRLAEITLQTNDEAKSALPMCHGNQVKGTLAAYEEP